ncbi:MAG: hypothetical protein F4Z87_05655, partial [Gammaproteobacteria bacterium]|nr:hypothetical protein [Gammaproteobacteria bacterium]
MFMHQDSHHSKPTPRPLAVQDLGELMKGYSQVCAQMRARVDLVLTLERDSTQRTVIEDKDIDLCNSLEALFM